MRNAFLFSALAALLLTACRDNTSEVPLVSVDFQINVNEPAFFDLAAPTGWLYATGGSRGIIIYRNSQNEFTALDRHATYDIQAGCAVTVADDGVILDDPCSDSQWLIIDGSVVTAPANQPLKQYRTSFNDPYLRVFN